MTHDRSPTRSLAREVQGRTLTAIVRARLVFAPLLGSVALTFAFLEPTTWRRLLLGSAVTLLFGLAWIEWLRYRRRGLSAILVPVNVLLTALGQLLLLTASGGLFSPVAPALVMMALITALLADRKTVLALLAMVAPYFGVLAFAHTRDVPVDSLIPVGFGGAQAIEHGVAPWFAAALYTMMMIVASRVGLELQRLFDDLFHQALRERDQHLALHAEQNRALTTLTAEIAHELKNPLASVKGLAALVGKDVEGRTQERVAVLRREVDRMQTILEEFLNFSRPLVPLSLADVDLAQLATDVARLHEGSAGERAVRIAVVDRAGTRVRCDPRKVRQIVINLLQNALHASPRDAVIEVAIESVGDQVRVAVADEGTGVASDVANRLFEAGVTSKEHGSGLGLAVARSLARQHGGDLTLANRAERGAIATLTLPRHPSV